MSVKEFAAYQNMTERAVWNRIYRNQLPHKRWGRRVLISLDEWEKLLDDLPGCTAQQALDVTEAAEAARHGRRNQEKPSEPREITVEEWLLLPYEG